MNETSVRTSRDLGNFFQNIPEGWHGDEMRPVSELIEELPKHISFKNEDGGWQTPYNAFINAAKTSTSIFSRDREGFLHYVVANPSIPENEATEIPVTLINAISMGRKYTEPLACHHALVDGLITAQEFKQLTGFEPYQFHEKMDQLETEVLQKYEALATPNVTSTSQRQADSDTGSSKKTYAGYALGGKLLDQTVHRQIIPDWLKTPTAKKIVITLGAGAGVAGSLSACSGTAVPQVTQEFLPPILETADVLETEAVIVPTDTEAVSTPTLTVEPTAIPLPVGSEPTANPESDPTPEATPTKEILVSKTVSLKPIDQVEELAGIEFDLNPIRQLFPELTNIELLAATNGMQGDSMRYVVVIKDGNRLVMSKSINHDGQEFLADYPSYFNVQPDGVLTPRIEGVTYTLEEIFENEPLAASWNQEYPTIARAPLSLEGTGEPIYAQSWVDGKWVKVAAADGMTWDGEKWIIPAPERWDDPAIMARVEEAKVKYQDVINEAIDGHDFIVGGSKHNLLEGFGLITDNRGFPVDNFDRTPQGAAIDKTMLLLHTDRIQLETVDGGKVEALMGYGEILVNKKDRQTETVGFLLGLQQGTEFAYLPKNLYNGMDSINNLDKLQDYYNSYIGPDTLALLHLNIPFYSYEGEFDKDAVIALITRGKYGSVIENRTGSTLEKLLESIPESAWYNHPVECATKNEQMGLASQLPALSESSAFGLLPIMIAPFNY